MSRLIDADECPCVLCEDIRNAHCTYEHRSCSKFCTWLNNTAYNVDKVLEELDEYITKIVGRKSALYQTIMGIVRKGGVE